MLPDNGHLFAQVHAAVERLDLLEQGVGQFLSGTNRNGGDIVNRFVRIKLGALTARLPDGIDNLSFQSEEPQLEDLEQAARSGADDDCIRIDHSKPPSDRKLQTLTRRCCVSYGEQAGNAGSTSGCALYVMRQGWSVSLTVLDGTLHKLSGDGWHDVRNGSFFAGRIFTTYLAAHRSNGRSMAGRN